MVGNNSDDVVDLVNACSQAEHLESVAIDGK